MRMNPDFHARLRGEAGRFLNDERGATAIEYALIASGVAVAIASTVVTVGSDLSEKIYKKVLDAYPS